MLRKMFSLTTNTWKQARGLGGELSLFIEEESINIEIGFFTLEGSDRTNSLHKRRLFGLWALITHWRRHIDLVHILVKRNEYKQDQLPFPYFNF